MRNLEEVQHSLSSGAMLLKYYTSYLDKSILNF